MYPLGKLVFLVLPVIPVIPVILMGGIRPPLHRPSHHLNLTKAGWLYSETAHTRWCSPTHAQFSLEKVVVQPPPPKIHLAGLAAETDARGAGADVLDAARLE
jgi:hypothetical protein